MRNYTSIHQPSTFEVQSKPDDAPCLVIDGGFGLVFFNSWTQFEAFKNEVNRAWYAFQADEEQRQIGADVDDVASRDGDRNLESTMAMGGAVI